MVIRGELHRLAKQLDFEVIDLRSPPVENILEKNLQKLIDKAIAVDAVYQPPDGRFCFRRVCVSLTERMYPEALSQADIPHRRAVSA
jgi:hypothetical protein